LDNNIINRISKFINREKIGFRKKSLIFSFFLLVAITIWFLKALEKNYTTEIDYPVRYRNFPNSKTLIGEVPDQLKLTVYAHGYVLLQHKISSRYIPIVVSVRSFSLNQLRGADSGFYFIETRYMKDYIDKQLSSEFDILEIKPDTLVFPFADIIERILPVEPQLGYTLDQQLILKSEPFPDPDSVRVSGPDYILDTLKSISTRRKDLGLISKSGSYDFDLKTFKHISIQPDEVEIVFDVERFTEKTLSIPISVKDLPDTLKVITFPSTVRVSCQVGLSNYERLQEGMFSASVNYSDIKAGQARLKIEMERSPDFINALNFSPKTVEYLIEK
jgi:hypothetical protein